MFGSGESAASQLLGDKESDSEDDEEIPPVLTIPLLPPLVWETKRMIESRIGYTANSTTTVSLSTRVMEMELERATTLNRQREVPSSSSSIPKCVSSNCERRDCMGVTNGLLKGGKESCCSPSSLPSYISSDEDRMPEVTCVSQTSTECDTVVGTEAESIGGGDEEAAFSIDIAETVVDSESDRESDVDDGMEEGEIVETQEIRELRVKRLREEREKTHAENIPRVREKIQERVSPRVLPVRRDRMGFTVSERVAIAKRLMRKIIRRDDGIALDEEIVRERFKKRLGLFY